MLFRARVPGGRSRGAFRARRGCPEAARPRHAGAGARRREPRPDDCDLMTATRSLDPALLDAVDVFTGLDAKGRERALAAAQWTKLTAGQQAFRSEERRVGKKGVVTLRSRWSAYPQKKKKPTNKR